MKVIINPTTTQKLSGLTASVSWENPDVVQAINQIFHIKTYEEIIQIEIDNRGITARIQTK